MIELQYFERSDFQQLIDWMESPPFMLQWAGSAFEWPLTTDQLKKYIDKANKADADTWAFKVINRETGNVIGHISLGRIDRKNHSARVGKVLVGDQKARGQGIGQQMIAEILKIAFEKLHLHRVHLGVFDFNLAAISCYEKAGFKKDGLLRDSIKNGEGDEYWNMWEMSILENEWKNQD